MSEKFGTLLTQYKDLLKQGHSISDTNNKKIFSLFIVEIQELFEECNYNLKKNYNCSSIKTEIEKQINNTLNEISTLIKKANALMH